MGTAASTHTDLAVERFLCREGDSAAHRRNFRPMKAIIIAAGLGSRLGALTEQTPKCLMQVAGKSILQRQIDAFRAAGVRDIVVVAGYQRDKLPADLDATIVVNERFRHNNILNSLMMAEAEMDDGFVATYADLVFEPRLVQELLDAPGDIVISVERDWKPRYDGLADHPFEAMEKVQFDDQGLVREVGKVVSNDAPGEFVGIMRCSAAGARSFREAFAEAKASHWGQPWMRAADFEKAYLTDLLQDLIDRGQKVHSAPTGSSRWFEIDTEEDLDHAAQMFSQRAKPG